MAADLLCLQWNEFQANQASAYRSLRRTTDFSDVTLVCEDGQRIEAHRLVLASSSLFFQDLLQKEAHQHPLIFMRGLTHATLAALVDFIYHGEAEVKKANLEEFLKVAGELRVKGMTKPATRGQHVNQDVGISHSAPEKVEEMCADEANSDAKQEVLNDIMSTKENLDCDECGRTYGSKGSLRNHKNAHKKSREIVPEDIIQHVDTASCAENAIAQNESPSDEIKEKLDCNECGRTYGSKNSLRTHKYTHTKNGETGPINPLDTFEDKYAQDSGEDNKHNLDLSAGENLLWEERIDALAEHREDGWTCKQCGKQDRNRFTARRHIETHIEGFTFSCTLCEKTFSQRNHLKTHMGVSHGGWNSSRENKCNTCNKVERSAPALKLHKQKVHFDEA